MPLLIATVGVPGSGKTTWAKQYHDKHKATVFISNDEVRKELFGTEVCNPEQNPIVYEEVYKRVEEALKNNHDVVVDGTHVHPDEWAALKLRCLKHDALMVAKIFDIAPGIALERMNKRDYKVPYEVIEEKYNTLQMNKKHLRFYFNWVDEFDL